MRHIKYDERHASAELAWEQIENIAFVNIRNRAGEKRRKKEGRVNNIQPVEKNPEDDELVFQNGNLVQQKRFHNYFLQGTTKKLRNANRAR